MENRRWWNLAIIAMTVLLSVIIVIDSSDPDWRRVGALASISTFAAAWFALAPAARRDGPGAVTLTVIVVVLAGVGTGFTPSFAIVQFIAFPLVWTLSCTLRRAIVANVALCLAVAGGFVVSLGTSQQALIQTGLTATLSLGFSIAFGLWITHIYNLSDERRQLIEQLTEAQSQLSALSRESGMRSERERLAREMHDTIAQSLTGLVLLGQRARRELTTGLLSDSTLALIEDSARDALVEARSIVAANASVAADGAELLEALERLAEHFRRETGLRVDLDAGTVPDLDRESEVVLLRCVQEALANVRKHADASSVQIRIDASADAVHLSVTDDGRGLVGATGTGYGLQGMRERLALVGGSLTIMSGRDADSRGTALAIDLPVEVSA